MTTPSVTVSVPERAILGRLDRVDRARFVLWEMSGPPPEELTMAVVPYMAPLSVFDGLRGAGIRVVQGQSIGYDGVADALPPGTTFCNATGVHEASTAELAVALTLASLRGIPEFVTAQTEGRWAHAKHDSLADKRVLVIGNGGIGRAAAARFRPFEVDLVRVATRARTDDDGPIHGIAELDELVPTADVIVLAVPLTTETTHMVDDAFLGRMKLGALVVNVSRGPVVDTDALVAHASSGRIRAALDVTDPEPLPADHTLWTTPGVLISPHVGGHSGAMAPRVDRLIREQAARLVRGEDLVNVVLRT